MNEPVRSVEAFDQLLEGGLPQHCVALLRRHPENQRKCRDLEDAAEAGEKLQRLPSFDRQALQLRDHKGYHVIGMSLGVNPFEVPRPARRIMVEEEHSFFSERRQKLNRKKWIAGRLLVHKLRQRGDALRRTAKSIAHQLLEVFSGEGRKRDLFD